MGLINIDKDFMSVEDIIKKDDSTIAILGKGGEKIDVPCNVNFLND